MKSLTFVEIDLPYCANTYGVAPCTASVPTTGPYKCFNTLKTCQDRANFAAGTATLRFAKACDYLPKTISITAASIVDVSFTPAVVSLGEDLGLRASVSITFEDHPHSDAGPTGFDKYLSDRTYDPFRQGSFWGKFRARQPYLAGRSIRLIRGVVGQALTEMDTRHYVVESFDGPTPEGRYTIIAKDALKLADGDRAQAPRPSNGFLSAGITDADAAATLNPSGIGDAEYPSSGYVAIGGKEIAAFTRSGDALTLTRAQFGTTAQAHSTNDRVQLVLRYSAMLPSDIIRNLLVVYAGVPTSYINSSEWNTEVESYYDRVMTGVIAEPTSVADLINEIISQAALALWWNDSTQKLNLKVIRAVPATAAAFNDDNVLKGTLQSQEQPDKRISQVQTYFGQRNPLEGLEDPSNYRSSTITINTDAVSEYGSNRIKTVFSRWIPFGGLTIAQRLNGLLLGRFRDPPRRFSFALYKFGTIQPAVGTGYQLSAWSLQDQTGASEQVPIQLVSLNPEADQYQVEAEEMRFDSEFLEDEDISARVITIDGNINNINLRTLHDTLYSAPTTGDAATVTVTCIINSGVIVGSDDTAAPAFDVGSWPTGWDQDNLIIVNNGRIQGRGGLGGAGGRHSAGESGRNGQAGGDGGPALYTRTNITVTNNGEIFGGGGGGGGGGVGALKGPSATTGNGGGGGGGRGQAGGDGGGVGGSGGLIVPATAGGAGGPSAAGTGGPGGNGTFADGGNGGDGGGAGAAGSSGTDGQNGASPDLPRGLGGAGGAAGAAVDGHSYVTYSATGSRLGGLIN
jgi:hypothetical protein